MIAEVSSLDPSSTHMIAEVSSLDPSSLLPKKDSYLSIGNGLLAEGS